MPDDHRIDEALRDVPVPTGLAGRVAPEVLFDDGAIDRLLAGVGVPAGLADRVRATVFKAGPGAVDLDRDTDSPPPAPAGRPDRHRRRPGGQAFPRAAVAASLAALAGLFVIGAEFARRMAPPPAPAIVIASQVEPTVNPAVEPAIGMSADEVPPTLEPLPELAVVPMAADGDDASLPVTTPDLDPPAPPTVRGATVGLADGSAAAGPGMRTVPLAGMLPRHAVPRVAGFDLAFEMAHGESPFVAAATLPVDHPPLALRTDSFAAFRAAANRRQRTTAAAGLRTEEILAALPAPGRPIDGRPLVTLQAVRSLRVSPQSCLVEVAVTAPSLPHAAQPPVDALLVLDRSVGMEPLAWAHVCRAVAAVAAEMRDGDRISVVVGGPAPRLAGSGLDAAGLARVAADLDREATTPTGDFDATMRAATAAAAATQPLIVVATSEAVDRARGAGRAAAAAWREAIAAAGAEADRGGAVRFVLLDAAEPTGREPGEPNFGRTAIDALEVRRALLERVFAMAGVTARQCRLTVQFNPRAVSAYRLVGHRQSAIESLAEGTPPAVDLHAGETMRVVYEVVRRALTDTAVTASLAFRPVGTGPEQTVSATLPASGLATVPLPAAPGCELLLAVAVGELAGGSPHAVPRGPAAQMVAEIAAAWRARGDLTPLGEALLTASEHLGIVKAGKSDPRAKR
jgi:hypothetical protein